MVQKRTFGRWVNHFLQKVSLMLKSQYYSLQFAQCFKQCNSNNVLFSNSVLKTVGQKVGEWVSKKGRQSVDQSDDQWVDQLVD